MRETFWPAGNCNYSIPPKTGSSINNMLKIVSIGFIFFY